MKNDFLPISKQDLEARGWSGLDIILITADAYVDLPSYGIAVIGRLLESKGYKVGVIAQPDWHSCDDFLKLGKPRLFFGISSGNVDSMVANYTANKRKRKTDDYSPGAKAGMRPDRAVIVYANRTRQAFGKIPIVLGGIEASLKRLGYYDYWDDCVRRSILVDSKADILVYGMAETQILQIADYLSQGKDINVLNNIRGTVVVRRDTGFLKDCLSIPSFEQICKDRKKFNTAFRIIYSQQDPYRAKTLIQAHADRSIVQFPPALPLSTKDLDAVYELPYCRRPHPIYDKYSPGIKGFESVKFSIISHRGCCGECSFCSLYFHQGRIIQSRSADSILREAKEIANLKNFRGTITDVGGPTANLYKAVCALHKGEGFCKQRSCLFPRKCKHLKLGYRDCLDLYRKIRSLARIKHVFIGSGLRYDLLTDDYARDYLREICKHHISGQMKVAPEHKSGRVLEIMNKPCFDIYERFVGRFNRVNKRLKKKLFLVNYFITSHPGSGLEETMDLSRHLLKHGLYPEQIQDFIPLPMTLSACIYYTGIHPLTGEKVYVPRTFRERKVQRAFLQYRNQKSRKFVTKALKEMKKPQLLKEFLEKTSKTSGKR